mmetsp:Transcript_24404/g.57410  ORF Transcript_24404/g.57410 Transcript_24404/m.57410 type:complete len:250 (-) Transcript_24404:2-751(-)
MGHLGHADRLGGIPTSDYERCPLLGLLLLLREADLHRAEERMVLHRLVALLDELDLILANSKRNVVRLVDPRIRLRKLASSREIVPVLATGEELLAHVLNLVGRHGLKGAIRILHLLGVIWLHEAGMTGACIVEAIGAFLARCPKALEHHHLPVGLQLLQHQSYCGAHHAGTNEDDIHLTLLWRHAAAEPREASFTWRGRFRLRHSHGASSELAVQLVDGVISPSRQPLVQTGGRHRELQQVIRTGHTT